MEKDRIIQKFLETDPAVVNAEVMSLMIAGSATDLLKKDSDIDLVVLLDKGNNWSRGVKIVENCEIDYFIFPKSFFPKFFENAVRIRNIFFIDLIANSQIVFDKNGLASQIKTRAESIVGNQPEMSEAERNIAKYFLRVHLQKLNRFIDTSNNYSWYITVNVFLNYCIEVFCRLNQLFLVKKELLPGLLLKIDSVFHALWHQANSAKSQKEKMDAIEELHTYLLDLLGGETIEWRVNHNCKGESHA